MDLNLMRSAVTVASLLLFVALMVWTMNKRRGAAFDEAAQLPLVDDPAQPEAQRSESR